MEYKFDLVISEVKDREHAEKFLDAIFVLAEKMGVWVSGEVMEKHRCGGTLKPQKVKIRERIGCFYHAYKADGFKCDTCEEEVISRDVALELEEDGKETPATS